MTDPHKIADLAAERAVLGAVLVEPEIFPRIANDLHPGDFSSPGHAAIWGAFVALHQKGDPHDVVTVRAQLKSAGTLSQAGDAKYLAELEAGCPTTANVDSYVAIVLDRARRRHLVGLASGLISDAADLSFETQRATESFVNGLGAGSESLADRAPTLCKAIGPALELYRRRYAGEEKPLPLPWPGLGSALGGGLWPGLHVLTGATGTGKTAAALQVGLSAARAGHPVLYVALELDRAQIVARLCSLILGNRADGGIVAHWSAIYLGKVDPTIVAPALEELSRLPIHVEEAPLGGWSARNLAPRCRSLIDAHQGCGRAPVVIVDYLQLVGPTDPTGRREELRERIGAAAGAGRQIARDHGAVVLMLSSVSREAARDLGKRSSEAKLGDGDPSELVGLGKESGDIEYNADTVMALATEPRSPGASSTPVWIAVGKQRAGRPSWHLLRFNGSWISEVADSDRERHTVERRSVRDEAKARKDTDSIDRAKETILRLLQAVGHASRKTIRAEFSGRKDFADRAMLQLEASKQIDRSGPLCGGYPTWRITGWAGVGPRLAGPTMGGVQGVGGPGPYVVGPAHLPPPPAQANPVVDEKPAHLAAGQTRKPRLTPEERAYLLALPDVPTGEESDRLRVCAAAVEKQAAADAAEAQATASPDAAQQDDGYGGADSQPEWRRP